MHSRGRSWRDCLVFWNFRLSFATRIELVAERRRSVGQFGLLTNESVQTLEEKAKQALDCPCVASLRNGPCGPQFSSAFVCYVKSQEPEKVELQASQTLSPDFVHSKSWIKYCKLPRQASVKSFHFIQSKEGDVIEVWYDNFTKIWQGSDCVEPFVKLQNCMLENEKHFIRPHPAEESRTNSESSSVDSFADEDQGIENQEPGNSRGPPAVPPEAIRYPPWYKRVE